MKTRVFILFLILFFIVTIQLTAVYHKVSEKNLYYFTSFIAKKDNTLLIGTDESSYDPLFVINVEDIMNPQIIGEYGGFQNPKEICIIDTFIYISDDSGNLKIGNISNPNNIIFTEKNFDLAINSLKPEEPYIYLGSEQGFFVLDTSSPQDPVVIDSLDTPEIADLTLNNNTVYALTENGVYMIDISIPQEISLESVFVEDFSDPISIAYLDDHIYILGDWCHFYSYDISNIQQPTLVADRYSPGKPQNLFVKDSLLFASDPLYGVGIYDNSNPSEITLVNNYVTPREAIDCCMNKDYLFIADWSYGLEIVERNDSPNPHLIQNCFRDDLIMLDYLDWTNCIYFTDNYKGFGLFEKSDPQAMPVFPFDSTAVGSLSCYGNYVYVSYSGGILIYDCEDPLEPVLVNDYPHGINYMKVQPPYAYGTSIDRLKIYSLDDPTTPNYLGNIPINGLWDYDYDVSDSVICMYGYDSVHPYTYGLYFYNTYQSGTPAELALLELDHAIFEIKIFGSIVLAAYYNESWYGSSTGFYVINIDNPTNPTILDNITVHLDNTKLFYTGFGSIRFAKKNNTLVVADNSNNRIITYDCNDFSNLEIVDEFWWNHKTTNMNFSGNELITCNFGNGITVMDWSDMLAVDEPPILEESSCLNVFPNPTSSLTHISFNVNHQSEIKLGLYNVKGQKIISIINEVYNRGKYTIEWNVNSISDNNISQGIYFLGLEQGGVIQDVEKVIIF